MKVAVSVAEGTLSVLDPHGVTVLRAVGQALLSDGRVLSTLRPDDGLAWDVTSVDDQVEIRLRVRGRGVGVEQLRPLVAAHGYAGRRLGELRIQQTGWQSWSRAHPPAAFEANLTSAGPPIRGPELPHRRRDSEIIPWVTVLESDAVPSLLIGFCAARSQLGTIEVIPTRHAGHGLVAATELEGVEVSRGAELASEPLLIGMGETAALLDGYARRVAVEMQARAGRDVLTGWCSWYQLYTAVSEADVDRNIASLVQHRDQVPLRLIQLDDGYQHAVGDWLELNEKFPSGMPALVGRMRQAGFMPGVWLAPFLLSARSQTFAEHPDWVVRDAHGSPLNALDNWGSANYALDTTQPDALRWIEQVIRTVGERWGYEYLKLDFLYAAAMRGQRHEPNVTGVEAYRRGMEALRAAAGDRFILGCGAPLVPSVGVVDGMRIGSDVAAYWGEEGNSDGPSLRNATRATLARLWLHDRWWTNDPDCLIVRDADSELTRAEVQAWLSVVALSGGMIFVGDDLSRLDATRHHLIERLLPPSGVAARASGPLVELLPERLHLRITRGWAEWDVVGVANWSDAPRRVTLETLDARSHVFDLWSGEYLGRHAGPLDLGELASHGMRVLAVHPDLGQPQVVGSTGHLLGDAMDLCASVWDPERRTLTLELNDDGPRARRGEVVVYDPDGPPRRISFSGAEPRSIRLDF